MHSDPTRLHFDPKPLHYFWSQSRIQNRFIPVQRGLWSVQMCHKWRWRRTFVHCLKERCSWVLLLITIAYAFISTCFKTANLYLMWPGVKDKFEFNNTLTGNATLTFNRTSQEIVCCSNSSRTPKLHTLFCVEPFSCSVRTPQLIKVICCRSSN